jgi:2-isopropylmalate synthase
LVRRAAGLFTPHFERLSYHVDVESDRQGELNTEATVKLRIGDTVRHEVAEGDGPVNALDAAMRKALEAAYPNLAEMALVDYKVRVINSEAATAAGVRVVIESRDEQDLWGTVGVSENVIEASWLALVDSFEYKLCKDETMSRSHDPRQDRSGAAPFPSRQAQKAPEERHVVAPGGSPGSKPPWIAKPRRGDTSPLEVSPPRGFFYIC